MPTRRPSPGSFRATDHFTTVALRKPAILAHRRIANGVARVTLGQWLFTALFAGGAVAAFALAPDDEPIDVPMTAVVRELPLPAAAARTPSVYWHDERVERGDTIGSLLARAGVDDAAAFDFLRADPSARALYQLRPGRPLHLATDDDGRPASRCASCSRPATC